MRAVHGGRSAVPARIYQSGQYGSYVCVGPGKRGAQTLEALFANQLFANPQQETVFVSVGYAGALVPEWKTGTLVLSDRFQAEAQVSLQMPRLPSLETFLRTQASALACVQGCAFSSEGLVSDLAVKDRLRQQGADLVEMEDYWLAQYVLRQPACYFYSLRVILDSYHCRLPDLQHLVSPTGESSVAQALRHLWYHPRDMGALIGIWKKTRQVAPVLRGACQVFSRVF